MIYFCKMISTKQALRNLGKCFRKVCGCKRLSSTVTFEAKHSIKCGLVGKGHTFPEWNAFKDELYRKERGFGN